MADSELGAVGAAVTETESEALEWVALQLRCLETESMESESLRRP